MGIVRRERVPPRRSQVNTPTPQCRQEAALARTIGNKAEAACAKRPVETRRALPESWGGISEQVIRPPREGRRPMRGQAARKPARGRWE